MALASTQKKWGIVTKLASKNGYIQRFHGERCGVEEEVSEGTVTRRGGARTDDGRGNDRVGDHANWGRAGVLPHRPVL